MCKMQPKWGWDWTVLLTWIAIALGLFGTAFFLTGGCTVRVEGFQRPETELRAIIQEECIRGIHAYQQYLERERETDGTRPMKPVS